MYTTTFPEVEDVAAKHIIQSIERILGSNNGEHKSNLVQLLKRGIVIHHGSVPLEVRFLIEDFIKLGFAKICFATSTLAQGVNMPFDIVWLDNMRFIADSDGGKSLALKNLIGRAGRLSDEASFDFGYVYTSNPKLFSKRINDNFVLNENSVIDMPVDDGNNDSKELLDAIKTNTFDDDMQAALTKIERLSSDSILDCCQQILDILYSSESFRSVLHGGGNAANRNNLMLLFKAIFEASINRELFDGERAVFEQAISIFLQVIQGRAFKEIVGIRYSYISRKDSGHSGFAEFSQPAEKLPNAKLKKFYSLLKVSTPASKVSYDTIVFDTYDYIDQVLSFSLIDAFIVAFKVYKNSSNDIRVDDIINLFRFGTNNKTYTLLMRYGFPPESVAEIEPFISLIDEDKIHFKPSIYGASQQILDLVEWYLP